MINQIKRNTLFYFLTILFIIIGLGTLVLIDIGDDVLYFGTGRNYYVDWFFRIITQFGEAATYVAILIIMLFIKFRYALMLPVIGVLVTIVSYGLKTFFKQPRPALFFRGSGELEKLDYVDGVDLLTGLNSFPSGHTMSAFCLFGFLAYVLHTQRFSKTLQFSCFLLALLVAISRVYLFQHFLKDIVFGAFMGTLLALIIIAITEIPGEDPNRWYNKSLKLPKIKNRA